MKTLPDFGLNWVQECDGLGMIAKDRQAELSQDASANRSDNPVVHSQNQRANRFLQAIFNFATALRYRIVPA